MRNWIKTLLKISAIVLVVGLVFGTIGFALRKGKSFSVYFENGKIVSSDEEDTFKTLPKTTIDSFDVAEINVDYADVEFVATDDEYAIEYKVHGNEPEYDIKDGKLTFTFNQQNKNSISIIFSGNTEQSKITFYVPGDKLSSITINSNYGDVILGDMEVSTINLDMNYGDANLTNVNVSETFKIESDYGDVVGINCSFAKIDANLSYGDVEFDKVAISGDVAFELSYGDVDINLTSGEISYDLKTHFGDIVINGKEVGDGSEQSAKFTSDHEGSITVTDDYGDININY